MLDVGGPFDIGLSPLLLDGAGYEILKTGKQVPLESMDSNFAAYVELPRPLVRPLVKSEPYPYWRLGRWQALAALSASKIVGSPVEMCAQSALAISALAAQSQIDVVLPTGSISPVSLAILTIAESGDRKSATDKLLSVGIRLREEDAIKRYKLELQSYSYFKLKWDDKMKAAIRNASVTNDQDILSLKNSEPIKPKEPLLTVGDPTIEGIFSILENGQSSIGMFSDEAGAFIGGYGMSKDRQLKTAAQLSSMWDGSPIKRVRRGSPTTYLSGRRLSIHLMAQPAAAASWLNNPTLRDQGLFSRMLIAAPESLAGTRFYKEVTDEDRKNIDNFVYTIHEHLLKVGRFKIDSEGELDLRAVEMNEDAKKDWWSFYEECESQIGRGEKFESVRPLAGKIAEHAARIAAVIAFMNDPKVKKLDSNAILCGIDIAKWYLNEAVRISKNQTVSDETKQAVTLLDWIRDTWPNITDEHPALISLPDIYMHGPYALRSRAMATPAVKILLEHGWLVRRSEPASINGKHRCKDIFVLFADDFSHMQYL